MHYISLNGIKQVHPSQYTFFIYDTAKERDVSKNCNKRYNNCSLTNLAFRIQKQRNIITGKSDDATL